MIQAIEGKIVADLYLWTTEERKLESSYLSDYCYETICDVWRSSTQKRKKSFFYWFFFLYILRSFFRKFQMSYQPWGFYLWVIWIRKQQLDVSNQNRISMALLTSKHSLLKNIQLFISAPIEKRLLLMLSSVKLEGKAVAVLRFRVMDLNDKKRKVFITFYETVVPAFKDVFRPSTV